MTLARAIINDVGGVRVNFYKGDVPSAQADTRLVRCAQRVFRGAVDREGRGELIIRVRSGKVHLHDDRALV